MEAEQERVSASQDGVPSLMDLKRQLPSHCFQSSLSKSISFVVKDFLLVASFAFSFSFLQDSFPTLAFALLPFFCFLQGTMFWAIFVLGHDCGHGSFSSSEKANDFFGHLLHTFILVPFHPWRLSHRKHHKNTGHIDNDEIFYPFRESRRARDADQAKRPHHIQNIFYLGFGWLGYLISGFNGDNSHFSVANNSIYSSDRERSLATKSLTLWWIWFSILIVWSYLVGPFVALVHYWIPLIVFATWLVVVTFLHHNEPGTTWLSGDRWSYVAGNLISVDRSYGIFESLHHDIGTHVVHHLFPAIPHYKLREADQALHKVLGPKQIKSKESIIPAFLRNWSLYRDHLFVPEDAVTYTYPVLSKKLH